MLIMVASYIAYSTGIPAQVQSVTVPKKDLVDVLIKCLRLRLQDSGRAKNNIIFSIIPVVPATSGQKQVAVSAINLAFYTSDPETSRLSSIYFLPYTNFSSRSGIIITPDVWLAHNRWNLNGDLRNTKSTIDTYGVGGNTPSSDKDLVDYRYTRIYLNASYRLWGPLNAGMGYALDYYHHVNDEAQSGYPSVFAVYEKGTGPMTTAMGLSFNFLIDQRKNSINPSGGFYGAVTYRINPPFLPNDLKWSNMYVDMRKYISLTGSRRSILACRALYWGTYGETPYLNLPGTMLDASGRTGRGYTYGRYRGKQMLYGETEWRFDLSQNGLWSGVLFFNVQSYTNPHSSQFDYLLPAAGTGLRLKFNKRNDMNITIDIGVGLNSINWYLNLGEFF